jgi:hypothetical protein
LSETAHSDGLGAYAAVLDYLVARVGQLEQTMRAAGLDVPPADEAAVEKWIAASAQRKDESADPRR